jgi:AcrR family transcriptional regulator
MRMSSRPPRRTLGSRIGGRSASVVERVLDAAAEELGRVGFAAMRIDDVAMLSGVNKTTIYRRWPDKAGLLAAVLDHESYPLAVPDTGSLEEDLRVTLRDLRTKLYTARERGVVRMLLADLAHPDVAPLIRNMRAVHTAARRQLFDRAVARGELPQGSDTELLVEFVTAPMVSRIMHLGGEVDDHFIEMLIAVITTGAAQAIRPAAKTELATPPIDATFSVTEPAGQAAR